MPIFLGLLVGWRGLAERTVAPSLKMPPVIPVSGYFAADAFPGLTFDQPVGLAVPPGETNRLFVVERPGRIVVVTNLALPTRTVFLDLSTNTFAGYLEAGLLGLAFHPQFATNGYFYVFRTLLTSTDGRVNLLHDQVSRFQVSRTDGNSASADSEQRLIAQYDDSLEHNAGSLQFGPDGYLYIALGDAAPPPLERSDDPQAIDRGFFGGILRIDVDKRPGSLPPNPGPSSTANYAIPPDNPFVGAREHNGQSVDPDRVRTEFYAVGLRNPWRMAFDTQTGTLYCGDVGNGDWEEINVIERGGNYGWPFKEGLSATRVDLPPGGVVTDPPLMTYEHGYSAQQGRCVVGGLVYRGSEFPSLYGAYVFGDYISGNQWALWREGNQLLRVDRLCGETGVAAYGLDPRDQGILLANFDRGLVQKLNYVPPAAAAPFPSTLDDTGVFADVPRLIPQPGVVEYEINVSFWSDNARKRRWFALPDSDGKIRFQSDGSFLFPEGTVWIKHFDLELTNGVADSARRIETRLLVKNSGGAYGVTYRWDETQTNAVLVPDEGADMSLAIRDGGGLVRTQTWHFPGRSECYSCHTAKAGWVLGFNAAQLQRNLSGGSGLTNQIACLGELGCLASPLPNLSGIRPLAAATNLAFPVGYRARSYLSANCSQCHQPELPGQGPRWDTRPWNARFDLPLRDAGIINGLLINTIGGDRTRVIAPHSLEDSILYWRVNQRARDQMPPLATSRIDPEALALLAEWINTLPSDPWSGTDLDETRQEGYDSVSGDTFRASGSGAGIGGGSDSFHFFRRIMRGDFEFAARVSRVGGGPDSAQFGIMVRSGSGPDEPFIMIEATPSRTPAILFRRAKGAGAERSGTDESGDGPDPVWMRLIRRGQQITPATSPDGLHWTTWSPVEVNWGDELSAGMAVASGQSPRLHTGVFEQVRLLGVTLTVETPSPVVAPAEIVLGVRLDGNTNSIRELRFFANGIPIETSASPGTPGRYVWRGAGAGGYSITAAVIDGLGNTVSSVPARIDVLLPPASGSFSGLDETTQGGWRHTYGNEGSLLFDYAVNLPAYAEIEVRAGIPFTWAAPTSDPRALESAVIGLGVASTLFHDDEIVLDVAFKDGESHQLSLYFLDFDGNNQRRQVVEISEATSGVLIDRRLVENFSGGQYLRWDLRGRVLVRIIKTGFGNAVVSGVFIDPPQDAPPWVSLTSPGGEGSVVVPAVLTIQADAYDPGGEIVRVEFLLDGGKIGESTEPPYAMEWPINRPGTFVLVARALDDRGQATTSTPVRVESVIPAARAEFAGADNRTQGDWIGHYGFEGYALAEHITNLPGFLTLEFPGGETYVWNESAPETQALERTDTLGRSAACWWARESFDLDTTLLDGGDHRLSLYLLDYDGANGRVQRIDVLDAADDAVLDSREVGGFSGGVYYTWIVRGHVRIRITRLTSNAVASGVFVDSLAEVPPFPGLGTPEFAADAEGTLRIPLFGSPNYPCLVETTTHLPNWEPWRVQVVGEDGQSSVGWTNRLESVARFFRARDHR